ncbi:baseplate J/gp47 family protein [Cohnella zeiphila]|uniref:Baseplate J/gp47 family protein n=1 Tax=Cohnella zeiphila TaxID=2761120 RepID=A0A7X0SHP1_9BACL|nr:baseplate J/gp47 family protein [Cohnella zeiphila]MBB6730061.1 baseplate J/gp47 family protein [Cohnella zeiphila]
MAVLPEYLTDQTEENIRARMLDRIPADVDKSEGSFVWDAIAPSAYELFNSAVWAQEVLRRGFASTTFGGYLDLRCEEHGLTRRPAVTAAGTVRLNGVPGTKIPAGTLFATAADPVTGSSSIEFATSKEAALDEQGTAEVDIDAVVAGSAGNVAAGAITLIVSALSGVRSVTNEAATTGGTETEDDESLLARYSAKVKSPGTSGNKADYIQWALSVPGVGGVQVAPLWDGPGTVKVTLLDEDKQAASSKIVSDVQELIAPSNGGEGLAPIGAIVTVAASTEVPIHISAKLTLATGTTMDTVKAVIEEGVQAYLQQLAFSDPLVRYTRISAILLDIPPIIDYKDLLVNGLQNVNIEMAAGEVAVLGEVNVS